MGRIDTRGPADFWLRGADLGTGQFRLLAGLAGQQEAEARRQFEADRAFEAQREDAQSRLGMMQEDHASRLARLAWQQEEQARTQASLAAMRRHLRERALAASGAPVAPEPLQGPWAPGTPGTVAQPPGTQPAGPWAPHAMQGAEATDPVTRSMLDLIDHADGDALRAIMPWVTSIEKQRELDRTLREIEDLGLTPGVLDEPRNPWETDYRPLLRARRALRDPDAMLAVIERAHRERARGRLASELGVDPMIASSLDDVGWRQMLVDQARAGQANLPQEEAVTYFAEALRGQYPNWPEAQVLGTARLLAAGKPVDRPEVGGGGQRAADWQKDPRVILARDRVDRIMAEIRTVGVPTPELQRAMSEAVAELQRIQSDASGVTLDPLPMETERAQLDEQARALLQRGMSSGRLGAGASMDEARAVAEAVRMLRAEGVERPTPAQIERRAKELMRKR